MSLGTKLKSALTSAATGSAANAFFGIFMGRCTFAAICFSVIGVAGWLHGKDLTSFTAFVVAIQGLLVVHSWKEDVAEQRQIRDGKNPSEDKV